MGKDVRKILALLLITAVILAFMTSCSFIEDLTGNLNIGEEDVTDDLELVAVIAAAIAASEGQTSTDGFVVRSIRKVNRRR